MVGEGIAIVWAIIGIMGCTQIAKKKGFNLTWAVVFGLLFGLFAIIVYALLPSKKGKKGINYKAKAI